MPANDYLYQAWLDSGAVPGLYELANGIRWHESRGRNVVNDIGATGAMQMMPDTFAQYAAAGHKNIHNPYDNALAALNMLKDLSQYTNGNPWEMLVGYYGGKGGIDKARRGIAVRDPKHPNYPSTFDYANSMMARFGLNGAAGLKDLVGRNFNADEKFKYSGGITPINAGDYNGAIGATGAGVLQLPKSTDVASAPEQGSEELSSHYPQPNRSNQANWASSQSDPNQYPDEQGEQLSSSMGIGRNQDSQQKSITTMLSQLNQHAQANPEVRNLFSGQTYAAPINLGGQHVLAMPSNASEKDFFSKVYSQPYSDEQKNNVIQAYSVVKPARDSLLGQNMFKAQPDDLDIFLRDIVDKAV